MKKTTRALVLCVLMTGSGFPALSQAGGPGLGPDRQWHSPQGDWHAGRDDRNDRHDRIRPGERERFVWRGGDFRRGHPLPPRFRGDDYRIEDWHHRGLYAPPRGTYWSDIDGNYVLIAAATGVITSIILGSVLGSR